MKKKTAKALLSTYHKKRDFKQTPEPSGKTKPKIKLSGKGPLFVVQKHDATRLHYDFRLEDEGVLKSWAVPKGPSLNPADRRLAIATEDHPVDYARFEGIIPAGNYGAGNVIVWDLGTFVNLSHDSRTKKKIPLAEGLKRGHVTVWLRGKKLQGAFTLTRLRGDGGKTPWLLIKVKDAAAGKRRNPVVSMPESVLSGRTVETIAAQKGVRTWKSSRIHS